MLIVVNSGSLSPLELSGPVQACNKIALPLFFLSGHYLRQEECEEPLSFFVAKKKKSPRTRTFGKHDGRQSMIVTVMFIQHLRNQKTQVARY